MIIYIFRHGDKSSDFTSDPALSPKGFLQAQNFAQLIKDGTLPKPDRIWVSQKKRTYQTASVVCESLNVPSEVVPDLNEREMNESSTQFRKRIQSLISKAEDCGSDLVLISHMDWIAECLALLHCQDVAVANASGHWQSGQFMGFEVQDSEWRLIHSGRLEWT